MFYYHDSPVELEYREYKLPKEFPCVAFLKGEYVFPVNQPSQLTFLHFHNCLEIGVCHEGTKDLYIEDYHGFFGTSDICVIPPYSMHISINQAGYKKDDCEYLYFDPEEILKAFYPGGIPKQLLWYRESRLINLFPSSQTPVLAAVLEAILEELRQKKPFYEYSVRGLILTLMVEFSRIISVLLEEDRNSPHCLTEKNERGMEVSSAYQERSSILPALDEIHQNWAAAPDICRLADVCHLSPVQFRRHFKELMRQTPSSYIRMIQLQKACELLYSTEKNILDIALESGFQSLSSFNRTFGSLYGKSPGHWRNEKRSIQKRNVKYSPFLPIN